MSEMNYSHDVAMICLNGHLVNDSVISSPEFNKKHCRECGAATTSLCPKCQKPIQGDYKGGAVIVGWTMPTPVHCIHCGEAFPWKSKVQKQEKKAQTKATPGEWFKRTAIGSALVCTLGLVGYVCDFWNKIPEPIRSWVYQNMPEVSLKWPKEKKK